MCVSSLPFLLIAAGLIGGSAARQRSKRFDARVKTLMPGGFTPPVQMENTGLPNRPARFGSAEQMAAKAGMES